MATQVFKQGVRLSQNKLNLPTVNQMMMERIIAKLKCSKGCRLDGISMTIFELIGRFENFCGCLSRLINHSFEHGTFPKDWKKEE